MKKLFCILLLCYSLNSTFAQTPEIAIIPEPVSLVRGIGHFTLPQNIVIEAPRSGENAQTVLFLEQRLSVPTKHTITHAGNTGTKAHIRLHINEKEEPQIGKEGYKLSITQSQISISANKPAGLFYGVQTLLQLFPKEIESKEAVTGVKWTAPAVEITDYPRLGWRGLMFDVSRHFFTKQEVKQYIDAMVRYKYNILHLHLTDDEGWRIEIKGLPKLTEVGAWRPDRTGTFGDFIRPTADEPRTYGGFYTQEDIKELVAYAQARFVNIMPEIDVPGHSLAAIASYPELSCTPDAVNYRPRAGEKIMDWSTRPPTALLDNTLCPANEKVYSFLDTVLTQVAALFPFEYIHLGGDEAPFNYWEKNDQVKALMQREGLKDMHAVQSYFEKRVQQIVESKGKRFMAWDEVLEGGVSQSAAVMSWRDIKYGIEASKNKHEVVMSPTEFAYIDYMQADAITEPRVYASLRLSKSYQFDPVPPGADPAYIKGGQANLWTEQVYNIRQAEYMTWPRGFAISESVWSPKTKKNWETFFPKVEQHFKRLDIAETKYAPSVYDPIFTVKRTTSGRVVVELSTEVKGLDIYYSFDNSFPDHFYPKYSGPLTVPIDASMMRVITYRGKQPVGRMMHMPVTELKNRAK